jgi:DNA-binding response OmpR family regulator
MGSSPVPGRLRVLVVDDEASIAHLVADYLAVEGFDTSVAFAGEDALLLARATMPDVIVLDVMLPGMDGIEVCRQLRTFTDAYLIMLTARADEADKLAGLSVGADDYLSKPFSPRELVARVKTLLRRPRKERPGERETKLRRFADMVVNPEAREVTVADAAVELTRLEFDLLDTLSGQPRLAFSRRQLIDRVWGDTWAGEEHTVDVHIANLRRKLGDEPARPRFVLTVRGVGYRMGTGS